MDTTKKQVELKLESSLTTEANREFNLSSVPEMISEAEMDHEYLVVGASPEEIRSLRQRVPEGSHILGTNYSQEEVRRSKGEGINLELHDARNPLDTDQTLD
jgi:hypothetical protein